MKIIRRLLRYATPLHHYVPEYMIYTLLGILFGLINFTMLIPMLNIMFGVAKTEPVQHLPSFSLSVDYFISLFNYYFTNIIAANGRMYALGFICTIILVATILSNLFRYLAIKVLIRLQLNNHGRKQKAKTDRRPDKRGFGWYFPAPWVKYYRRGHGVDIVGKDHA